METGWMRLICIFLSAILEIPESGGMCRGAFWRRDSKDCSAYWYEFSDK